MDKTLGGYKMVAMKQHSDGTLYCPECRRYNAMLVDISVYLAGKSRWVYKCRDCGFTCLADDQEVRSAS